MKGGRRAGILLVALLFAGGAAARAQEPPTGVREPTGAEPADSQGVEVLSPRGAALRSLLVPGWGQASFRSYVRGGVYFGARTGSWFMLLKTLGKISEARDVEARRVAAARDSILAALPPGDTLDVVELEAAIGELPGVRDARELIESRKEQREDWIAWVIFWAFADAADAYVNAQLSDFPADVGLEPRAGGGVELRVSWRPGGRP